MSKNPEQKRRGNPRKGKNPEPVISAENRGEAGGVGRNATERLLAIHQLISARRYPNTVRLAREFDVSQKTVKRDVEMDASTLEFAD
jgi:hypothetical protein